MRAINAIEGFWAHYRLPWYRIDITSNGVSKDDLVGAYAASKEHKDGVLPVLRYTEQNPAWALL